MGMRLVLDMALPDFKEKVMHSKTSFIIMAIVL